MAYQYRAMETASVPASMDALERLAFLERLRSLTRDVCIP